MARWPYNTSAWKRLRLAKLAHDPLCYACTLRGLTVEAVAVDHMHAIAKGGDPFPDFDRLMSLCERCHNEKTAAMDGPNARNGRRFKGFDASGNPIDPGDDWHGGTLDHENRADRRPMVPTQKYLVSDT